jgi:hypothetical protein
MTGGEEEYAERYLAYPSGGTHSAYVVVEIAGLVPGGMFLVAAGETGITIAKYCYNYG